MRSPIKHWPKTLFSDETQAMMPLVLSVLAVAIGAACLVACILAIVSYRRHARTLGEQMNVQAALAGENLKHLHELAKLDLDAKKDSIKEILTPLKESIAVYHTKIAGMENDRHAQDGKLSEQLRELMAVSHTLQKETVNLVHALKQPQVRGSWGEVQLRRVVELAGMSEHCDFTLQESVTTEEGRFRPDLIVTLPGERTIVVDAKAVCQAFLEAIEAKTDDERKTSLLRHARQIRDQVNLLASRRYSDLFENSPEFVVCFLHVEAFLYAACEMDKELVEYAMKRNIILATPTTLIALLKAVALNWRQEEIAKNAKVIGEQATALIERLGSAMAHLTSHGKHLALSIESYNKLIGSIEHKVMPQAERMLDLGLHPKQPLPELMSIETLPRLYDNGRLAVLAGTEDKC